MTTFIENSSDYIGETVTVEPIELVPATTENILAAIFENEAAIAAAFGETTVAEYKPRHQQWFPGQEGLVAVARSSHEGDKSYRDPDYAPRHQWQVRRHRQAPWGVA